ncbi:Fpg/Nei family DNA glycosylase, partial [Mycobacterium tuberculosis]
MPEGHTLHRLARLHQRRFAGAPVSVSSPQGRFADSASALNGRVLRRASA